MQKIMNIKYAKKLASKYWKTKQSTLNKNTTSFIFRPKGQCILCNPYDCNKCIYSISKFVAKYKHHYCVNFPLESTYDGVYKPEHTTRTACRKRAIIIYLYILLSYVHNSIYYIFNPFKK